MLHPTIKQHKFVDNSHKQTSQIRKSNNQNKPQRLRPYLSIKTNTTSPGINRVKNHIINSLTKDKS